VRGAIRVAIIAAILTSALGAQAFTVANASLFGIGGIRPEGVRQGDLGSCYVYSVLAAIAGRDPDLIKHAIVLNPDGTYQVTFADGDSELVHPEDVAYARANHFDDSDGNWVAVLLRAYAQRVDRKALVAAVTNSHPLGEGLLVDEIEHSDNLLLAYDRAVRRVITQTGGVDRASLRQELVEQAQAVNVPAFVRDKVAALLDEQGFFEKLAASVKENGEAFGMYRNIGQGGAMRTAFQFFVGNANPVTITDEAQVISVLGLAARDNDAVTAGTKPENEVTPAIRSSNWYVPRHAYTVLDFDPTTQRVTIRNPWGHQPDPDGETTVSLSDFITGFSLLTTSQLSEAVHPERLKRARMRSHGKETTWR
jgi:hypothetical protein